MAGTAIWTGALTMSTPEQGVIALIKDLRAQGVRYNQLMHERTLTESGTSESDRSLESIDEEIDELLDTTMSTVLRLTDDLKGE